MSDKKVIFLVDDDELFHQVFDFEFGDSNDVRLVISAEELDAWGKFQAFKQDITVAIIDGDLKEGGNTLKLMQSIKESKMDGTFSGVVIISSAGEKFQNDLLKIGGWDLLSPKSASINILDVVKRALDRENNPLKSIRVLVLERDMSFIEKLNKSLNGSVELIVLDHPVKLDAELKKGIFDLSFLDSIIVEEEAFQSAGIVKEMFRNEKVFITTDSELSEKRISAAGYRCCKKEDVIGITAAKKLAVQGL